MELIRGLVNLKSRHRGCVATIGNYDGVHLGHQRVLRELVGRARGRSMPATVIVFEPMPQEYFSNAGPPARLMNFYEKWTALAECGADRVLCLRFDQALSRMPAQTFIERILIHGLGVHHLVVGDDFRFGQGRSGDYAMLKEAGAAYGFEVAAAQTLSINGERVSSSRIRDCLAAGDLETAAAFLGVPFSVSGRVIHGERLGHTLGFPTANIPLKRKHSPVQGIFVAAVHSGAAASHYGAAYVPGPQTLNGRRPVLEVYIFDFAGELYGRRLQVELLHQVRADAAFENLDALKAQMARDVNAVHDWLQQRGMV